MQSQDITTNDSESIAKLLSGSGYSDKAIKYFLEKADMGSLPDADQVTELTGPCGDTMKIYLKIEDGRIKNAKMRVLGCAGAVASAMAAMELIKSKTIDSALAIKDRDIYNLLGEIPDQKQDCIRLTIKILQKAIEEYKSNNINNQQGE
ncbi:MAG: iron-sulfur cluster assembly scaffold protein [Desulfobacterales bacterium]|uniref:Iron-sulfur cluster assembly scaffold protein n=1 Tax=Candidatus Desulfatibia vada TaxID=2841696 RepID=A0A8J6P310_9BACT|nr:iron-sulfur cluster assembly scaffold protein [Candidatus Desulfatibia vada]MBL6971507.1 iron-sulfur cluster assembly scaffold protein [Desulfobacterales bacterium]